MPSAWEKTKLIAEERAGIGRSILGYAGESIIIGRALVCGYNLFFKAWRDSKYDAVLDHGGNLYRIEIKQTAGEKELSVTSGGRSGQQISRDVESREETISSKDCDFLFGVQTLSGRCWIVPIEVIEIFNKASLPFEKLADFEEAWGLFLKIPDDFGKDGLRVRLRELEIEMLQKIWSSLGEIGDPPATWRFGGRRSDLIFKNDTDRYAFAIWSILSRKARYIDD